MNALTTGTKRETIMSDERKPQIPSEDGRERPFGPQEEHQGGDARLDGPCRERHLGSAILSLLVAADQRCPAIIGQAHILYHGRFCAKPDNAERTFRQLKRDAADLFNAVAAVEAAMRETTSETS
jgi:hypothetical protein